MARRERQWRAGPINIRVSTPEVPKERLSRDRIVDVALRQLAEEGYDAVSMRSVARELGTGPASLYAHVPNKEALDQMVLDRIASMLAIPEPDPARWREQLRGVYADMLTLYAAHPGSARAAVATIPTMEGGLRVANAIMALLEAGGIHPQAAAWFLDLSALYVSAVAAEESIWEDRRKAAARAGDEFDRDAVAEEINELFSSLPASAYPALAARAPELINGDAAERFEFGLDVLIGGLEVVSARYRESGVSGA